MIRQVPRSLLLKQRKRLERATVQKGNGLIASAIADVFSLSTKSEPAAVPLFSSAEALEYGGDVRQFVLSATSTMGEVFDKRYGAMRREWKTVEDIAAVYSTTDWTKVPAGVARLMYLHGYGAYGPRRANQLALNETVTYSSRWMEPLTLSVVLYGSVLSVLGLM